MAELKDKKRLYELLKSKDPRFDGHFFVGVASTGIYCRVTCKAKLPRIENCHFYHTAAEAEAAGYRPCLTCRPELAPLMPDEDATTTLAEQAARLLDEECGSGLSLAELADRLGCSERHLRRVFKETYDISPTQFMQTCRLLRAKDLLTDTDLPILDVAMAAGYGSLRRFNETFQTTYRMEPRRFRRENGEGKRKGAITAGIGYQPPYRWDALLHFLRRRAMAGTEAVDETSYSRVIRCRDRGGREHSGWLQVSNNGERNILQLTISDSLIPVFSGVTAGVKRMFDVYCNPDIVDARLASLDQLSPGLQVPGTRVPGCMDAFELAVRAIVGQQISVAAAATICSRIAVACGTRVETGVPGLEYAFPTAEELQRDAEASFAALRRAGVTGRRAQTILDLAARVAGDDRFFDRYGDPQTFRRRISEIKGIGPWTADYIAMRALNDADAFLETDLGVREAWREAAGAEASPAVMRETARQWKPWRSYAVMSFWYAQEEKQDEEAAADENTAADQGGKDHAEQKEQR
ncbi:MAG: Ada metal-binding domain-containing protein [Anaerovoracaceae bacterium]